jgi:hypothetical protein
VIRFFVERVVLLAAVVAAVSAVEWVVALALGLHRSQWTLFGTAFGLIVLLRLWIAWKPRAPRGSRIKASTARWWQAHIAWETDHPLLGAACDGLVIFVSLALWSLLARPDDLSIPVAAECGAIVFAFGATIGVIGHAPPPTPARGVAGATPVCSRRREVRLRSGPGSACRRRQSAALGG